MTAIANPAAADMTAADQSAAARAAHPPPGTGRVELAQVNGVTRVVRLQSSSPLRLLAPQQRSAAAWVVAGTYGGGLVSGDRIHLAVKCGPKTSAILGTQASTKAYRSKPSAAATVGACEQRLHCELADGSLLVSWPDPVTCFANANYAQAQQFHLDGSASLLAVDWLTSGRMARGESWAFDRYESVTTISVDGRLRIHDALRLDPADGPIDGPARAGGMGCLGMAWMIGPKFAAAAAALLGRIGSRPIDRRSPVVFGVSPVEGGLVLRFAGRTTEQVTTWLREQLAMALETVGIDPWSRRG